MESFLLGLKIGGLITGAIGFIFAIIGGIYLLAKNDIFFTFVEEGTAKAIMKFGGFHRIVMQYENCRLDYEWDVVLDGNDSKKKSGLRWVGIPGIYSVYEYSFRWATVKPQKEAGEQVERRELPLKHIFVKDYVYLAEVKGAETKGLVPLDISFLVTARVVNPYKALFRVHDWIDAIISRIEAYFRQFVSQTEYEDLISQKQQMGGQIMVALENTGILGDDGKFLSDYGVKVKNIEMRDIDPVGENKKTIQEAATKKWVAERNQEQIDTLADAEVKRVKKVYSQITEFGDAGLAIKMLESIDKAGEKQGNWVIPFGSVQQLMQGFGIDKKTRKKKGASK